ncbi:MAG: PKD domain-containing protein [Candidatus Micrarchaeaceae archaeon]
MHYDGRRWWDETVEGEYLQYVGNDGALVLDAADHPHIVYSYGHNMQYAHHDGAALRQAQGGAWWIETVSSEWGGSFSLSLDAAGRGHIAYDYAGDLRYASRLCMPVLGAAIVGPARLPVGATGHYSATAGPLDAALPITLTWEDGTVGATAAYSWTAVGTATLAVTAANPCGEAQGTFTVTVCQPLTGAVITGPAVLFSGQSGTYQAAPQPITATPPLTFTWDNGTVGPSSTYNWAATGDYTLTVTATNDCGTIVRTSCQVQVVEWPYHCYLPLIRRE